MLQAEEEKKRKDTAANAERMAMLEKQGLVSKAEADKAKTSAGPKIGETFRDCPDCPEMVVVLAGEFTMGSPESEEGRRADGGPTRTVKIARDFAAGKFEVTFAEWDACVSAVACKHKSADDGWGRGRRPVINVAWDDAKEYVGRLSKMNGKPYRLLTEAEWEYAARGGPSAIEGGRLRNWWGKDASHEYANYGKDECCAGLAQGKDQWVNTAPVGQFQPNPFGLHDMHGNVWEWVEDC